MAERASPFDARSVLWLVLAGALAFAGFLFLSAYAPAVQPKSLGGFAPLSKSATGFAGLMTLIETTTDEPVEAVQDDAGYNEPGLLIVPLAPDSDVETIAEFARARAKNVPDGATLFILPKWQTEPLGLFGNRVQRIRPIDVSVLDALAKPFGVTPAYWNPPYGALLGDGDIARRPLPETPLSFYTKDAASVEPALTLAADHIVLGRITSIPGGATWLLADPDLLANHALKTRAGARAALDIIAAVRPAGADQISLEPEPARAAQQSTRNLLQLLFEPPFLAVTLAVLAAAVLAGWHAFNRFGPTLAEPRAIPFGKRALADNAALLLARAGAVRRLGDRYVALTRDAAAQALGATAMDGDPLERWLASIRTSGPDFATLAAAARRADTSETMRAAAAALHHWKEAVTRDDR